MAKLYAATLLDMHLTIPFLSNIICDYLDVCENYHTNHKESRYLDVDDYCDDDLLDIAHRLWTRDRLEKMMVGDHRLSQIVSTPLAKYPPDTIEDYAVWKLKRLMEKKYNSDWLLSYITSSHVYHDWSE